MSSAPLRRRLTVAAAAAAVVLIIVVMSSCSSAPLSPSLGPSGPALEATAAQAAVTERSSVDRFIELFSSFEAEALSEAVHQVYAADAHFNDGFVVLRGAEEIAPYLARSADHVTHFALQMQDVVIQEREVYLRWEMAYTVDGDTEIVAPGMTHLRFNAEGMVLYHRDYWDASGALVVFVPPAAKLLAAIRDRV